MMDTPTGYWYGSTYYPFPRTAPAVPAGAKVRADFNNHLSAPFTLFTKGDGKDEELFTITPKGEIILGKNISPSDASKHLWKQFEVGSPAMQLEYTRRELEQARKDLAAANGRGLAAHKDVEIAREQQHKAEALLTDILKSENFGQMAIALTEAQEYADEHALLNDDD